MLGDPNGWVRDRLKVGITDRFGVPGENDNGRMVIGFFVESNTYFEDKSLHKYTKVAK